MSSWKKDLQKGHVCALTTWRWRLPNFLLGFDMHVSGIQPVWTGVEAEDFSSLSGEEGTPPRLSGVPKAKPLNTTAPKLSLVILFS